MSNSPLVSYTSLSPNCSVRTRAIDRITIHHMAGDATVERCGEIFASAARQASANYGIGSDGRVGLYVPEEKRAWTSSSTANDDRAVTIEVANCGGAPDWPVSGAAYRTLILLCADVCRRNGIARLDYTGDASGNLTMHCWFAATACPGPYLKARFPAIAAEVNGLLAGREGKEVEDMARYDTVGALPEWARDTVKKLCSRGIIRGNGAARDAEGFPTDLDLSEDMARLLVWNDRAGIYGN